MPPLLCYGLIGRYVSTRLEISLNYLENVRFKYS